MIAYCSIISEFALSTTSKSNVSFKSLILFYWVAETHQTVITNHLFVPLRTKNNLRCMILSEQIFFKHRLRFESLRRFSLIPAETLTVGTASRVAPGRFHESRYLIFSENSYKVSYAFAATWVYFRHASSTGISSGT